MEIVMRNAVFFMFLFVFLHGCSMTAYCCHVTAECKSGRKRDVMNVCLAGGIWKDPACVNSASE
jgi:hypothetical protein